MAKLLIKEALLVATMDDQGREIADCDILIENGIITAVGSLGGAADEVIMRAIAWLSLASSTLTTTSFRLSTAQCRRSSKPTS